MEKLLSQNQKFYATESVLKHENALLRNDLEKIKAEFYASEAVLKRDLQGFKQC